MLPHFSNLPNIVYNYDSADIMAYKIFFHFEINQSAKVVDGVWEKIEYYDMVTNTLKGKRIYEFKKNCIGGPIAQKIFKRSKDGKTIWRVQ